MKRSIQFAAITGTTLALWPALAAAQSSAWDRNHGYGPHMMDTTGGWGHVILGPLFMILVVAALIAAVVLAVKWLGSGSQGPRRPDALDILKERYARGEIDKDEYQERRKTLEE